MRARARILCHLPRRECAMSNDGRSDIDATTWLLHTAIVHMLLLLHPSRATGLGWSCASACRHSRRAYFPPPRASGVDRGGAAHVAGLPAALDGGVDGWAGWMLLCLGGGGGLRRDETTGQDTRTAGRSAMEPSAEAWGQLAIKVAGARGSADQRLSLAADKQSWVWRRVQLCRCRSCHQHGHACSQREHAATLPCKAPTTVESPAPSTAQQW